MMKKTKRFLAPLALVCMSMLLTACPKEDKDDGGNSRRAYFYNEYGYCEDRSGRQVNDNLCNRTGNVNNIGQSCYEWQDPFCVDICTNSLTDYSQAECTRRNNSNTNDCDGLYYFIDGWGGRQNVFCNGPRDWQCSGRVLIDARNGRQVQCQ